MSVHINTSMIIQKLVQRLEELERFVGDKDTFMARHEELKKSFKEQELELIASNKRVQELEKELYEIKQLTSKFESKFLEKKETESFNSYQSSVIEPKTTSVPNKDDDDWTDEEAEEDSNPLSVLFSTMSSDKKAQSENQGNDFLNNLLRGAFKPIPTEQQPNQQTNQIPQINNFLQTIFGNAFQQPAAQSMQQPAAQPAAQQPMQRPAQQPMQRPAARPAQQLVQQPMQRPVQQPAQQPMNLLNFIQSLSKEIQKEKNQKADKNQIPYIFYKN